MKPWQGEGGAQDVKFGCGRLREAGAHRVKERLSRGLPSSTPPPFRGISGPSPSDVSGVAMATARLSQIKLLRASKVSWSRLRSKQWQGRGSARGSRGRSWGSLSQASGRWVLTRELSGRPGRSHACTSCRRLREEVKRAGNNLSRDREDQARRTRQSHHPRT